MKTDKEVTRRFDPDRIAVDMDREDIARSFQAPLYLLNIKKEDIPDHLPTAEETYIEPESCLGAQADYDKLEVLLGSDQAVKVAEEYGKINLDAGDAIESTITDFIPFDSIIKYMSGASKHEKKVASAYFRGQIRRAYLKGYIEQNNCDIPVPVLKPARTLSASGRSADRLAYANRKRDQQIYVEPSARPATDAPLTLTDPAFAKPLRPADAPPRQLAPRGKK